MNIKDIAKLCGVSPSTVSKILHNKDEEISADTRKKVLEIIKQYQYVPYSKVIKSAAPKTSIIGVLLSGKAYGVNDILYSIERAAKENGYSIMLYNTEDDKEKRIKYRQILENKGVDGIISILQEKPEEEDRIPAVYIRDRKHGKKENTSAEIYFPMETAGYLAADYLFERGHCKIACILGEEDEEIENGYLKAYKERFLLPDKEWIYRGGEEDIMETGIAGCIREDITAVICANAEIGNIVCERLRKRGDTIPGRVSVISVRDSELAEKLFPRMTAVQLPAEEIGGEAVKALIQIMEGRKPAYECSKKIGLRIVERASVMTAAKHMRGKKIVVVGSLNMDCMISVSHIPTGGETVRSRNIVSLPGGKGANQAVGAGKLDGLVYMIGCLGNDSDGRAVYNSLVNSGVRTDGVVFDNTVPTGKAYISVGMDGESTIIFYPGANEKLDCGQVRRYEQLLDDAQYCLLTLETSEEAVEYTIRKCKKKNVEVILKPASVEKIKESLLQDIDFFIPNEKELKQLMPGEASIEEKAELLLQKGVKNVIITLGNRGCYLKNAEQEAYFPAADFQALDTTGAADSFISALAVFLSEGNDIRRAISFATYAAGISITRQGGQPAMVERRELSLYEEEIESFYGQRFKREEE